MLDRRGHRCRSARDAEVTLDMFSIPHSFGAEENHPGGKSQGTWFPGGGPCHERGGARQCCQFPRPTLNALWTQQHDVGFRDRDE